ncbi:MAG: CHASE2 domain-containing protein [Lachnospiraceae bacterium]|nr:CHASE2 domain-containing protein [Lachnospiraceae bacterium]
MSRSFHIIFSFIMVAAAFLLVYLNPFYEADSFVTDICYNRLSGTDQRIVIIGIDEESLAAYGNYNLWSREKMTELIEKLYSDPENRPSVLGLDFIFSDHFDEAVDSAFVEAVKKADKAIVTGSNLVYRGRLERSELGAMVYNTEHIDSVEKPFDELLAVSQYGFTNECIAKDGYIRYAMNSVKVDEGDKEVDNDSFAYALYKLYCEKKGIDINVPKTNSNNQFQFRYSGKTGEFSKLSLEAVLSDKVPMTAFKDAIVLVGAYAPGFQDSYQPASDRGTAMYGVEIHANIIEAYLQEKTMVVVGRLLMAIITALLAGFIMLICRVYRRVKYYVFIIAGAILYVAIGLLAAHLGYVIPIIYFLLILFVAYIYFVVDNYQRELKDQMWSFTEAMATAIDERTPYNATHTRNVAKYCGMVADHINRLFFKGKEKEYFSENRKEQLVMGALMHDIGKIAVPLSVMNKATRLDGREKEIEKRLEIIRLKAQVKSLSGEKDEGFYKDIEEKVKKALLMIEKVNAAGFLNEETRAELSEVLGYEYEGEAFFTDEEKECLNIVKGTLTDEERRIMESHVTITSHILSKVRFNKYFKNSPKWAGEHHECLNGKGYPKGIGADELEVDSRIMAVCDICDALLATDRPYKKPLPFEKAFDIMRDMAKNGNIDGKYVEYLYECLKPQYE